MFIQFTEQFVCGVILFEGIKIFQQNSQILQNKYEYPQDLIKLGILYYVLNNPHKFKTYDPLTGQFKPFSESGDFIPFLPYQESNWLQQLVGGPSSKYHFRPKKMENNENTQNNENLSNNKWSPPWE